METKKLHYLIAVISYLATVLHFIFGDYTTEKLISGLIFFSVAIIIYVGFVYLFFKSKKGKLTTIWGLVFISVLFVFMLFNIDTL